MNKPHESALMKAVARRHRQPLEQLLRQVCTEYEKVEAAQLLGVSTATIDYWLQRFGISIIRVAVGPGDQVIIHK